MKIHTTSLPGVLLLEPTRLDDERGYFMEAFHQGAFDRAVGAAVRFVQDNQSGSRRGVVRGLHYQTAPHAQGKLVRVLQGAVYDVAVDLRRSSPTFGRWLAHELTQDNRLQVWIPPGFAHGFMALSEEAEVLYKVTAHYAPEAARSVRWDDPFLGISWPLSGITPIVSARDLAAPSLFDAPLFD